MVHADDIHTRTVNDYHQLLMQLTLCHLLILKLLISALSAPDPKHIFGLFWGTGCFRQGQHLLPILKSPCEWIVSWPHQSLYGIYAHGAVRDFQNLGPVTMKDQQYISRSGWFVIWSLWNQVICTSGKGDFVIPNAAFRRLVCKLITLMKVQNWKQEVKKILIVKLIIFK